MKSLPIDLSRRQWITLASIAGFFLVLFTPLFDIVFGFLLAGYIPGTRAAVPWPLMLLGYMAAGFFIIRSARKKGLYPGSPHIKRAQGKLAAQDVSYAVTHASYSKPATKKRRSPATGTRRKKA